MAKQDDQLRWERVMRRTRWYVAAVPGLVYVFGPGDAEDAWHRMGLLIVAVYFNLPLLIDTARGFRSGSRGDTPPRTP